MRVATTNKLAGLSSESVETLERAYGGLLDTHSEGHPSRTSDSGENEWRIAHEVYPEIVAEAQRKLGQVALGRYVEVEPISEIKTNETTLLANIEKARHGDEQAHRSVLINVETDMAERLYKSGHVTEVHLQIENGSLAQSGSKLADIQMNALRYTQLNGVMLRRTAQELENVHTFEGLINASVLDTHNAVVFSLCPDDEGTINDYNFYKDTASCSVQFLQQNSDSDVLLQTALVAGKATPEAPRHDKAAIDQLIMQASGEDAVRLSNHDDSLRYIMLLPKSDTPNGIIDVVRHYDEAVGSNVFYGLSAAPGLADYEIHQEACDQKARYIKQLAFGVAQQLIAESPGIDRPLDALKRLNDLSEASLVRAAAEVFDLDIDESVFGESAARSIRESRELRLAGDEGGAARATEEAIRTADSGSCPMNFSGGNKEGDGQQASVLDSISQHKFMRCPFCRAGQYGDPCARVLACHNCSARVVDGKVTSRGNGGKSKKNKLKQTSSWW